jgi:hypothetical protein
MSTSDGSLSSSTTRPAGRDWLTMTRDAFDVTAPTTQLALDVCPVTDVVGTGELDGSLTDD